jgi:hypothetical protein
MEARRVIVLSGRSLFAEGTASSLRRSTESLQVAVIDPREPQVLERIAELAPSIVILDSRDATLVEHCEVTALLDVLPDLRIIRLDPKNEQIQIVTGEHRKAASIDELIELICAATDNQHGD